MGLRKKQISLYLSDEEMRKFRELAKKRALPVCALIRTLVMCEINSPTQAGATE
jgi:hypothetical protein